LHDDRFTLEPVNRDRCWPPLHNQHVISARREAVEEDALTSRYRSASALPFREEEAAIAVAEAINISESMAKEGPIRVRLEVIYEVLDSHSGSP
jgi:hypothetical protein